MYIGKAHIHPKLRLDYTLQCNIVVLNIRINVRQTGNRNTEICNGLKFWVFVVIEC